MTQEPYYTKAMKELLWLYSYICKQTKEIYRKGIIKRRT